jgi:hypothetical protein
MTSKNFNTNTKTIINKSLNLNTMKNNYFKKTLKLGMTAIFIMALGTANAQTADPASITSNIQKGEGDGSSVRVIDNKGTIKYLQTNNGITSITSTTSGSATTTTFQLGGTLNDNTYIDVSGKVFALDGIALATGAASTDAVGGDTAKGKAANAPGTGYTFLVRNEVTGATEKIMLEKLITSAYSENVVDAGFITTKEVTISGISSLPTAQEKISVYRNGAKLRSGTDYTVATNKITLVPSIITGAQEWALYAGDIIEVYVLKF